MLAEATQIMKMLWNENDATFEGKYYQIRSANCEPKPKKAALKKKEADIKDLVPVKINDARGVTLFGESLTKEELLYETN